MPTQPANPFSVSVGLRVLEAAILAAACLFFALHFAHLSADFPNHSPWMDWSKYTDEGWYGDAAIRHALLGKWYVPGDFNPAAALPMWPFLEAIVFHFAGVSVVAARALSVSTFGGSLVASYFLLRRWQRRAVPRGAQLAFPFSPLFAPAEPTLAPAIAVLLLAVSPFCFVFSRLAILEPLLVFFTLLALHAATSAPPACAEKGRSALRRWFPTVCLGALLPALVLTKTTAVFLFPAIYFLLWASAGYRVRTFLRTAFPASIFGALLWSSYFFLLVRPRYLEDYRYLFSANGYTGINPTNALSVLHDTILGGMWIGNTLYLLALLAAAICMVRIPSVRRDPLPAALVLWAGGYAAFLAYHNNLQPRYYLVLAVPLILLVANTYGSAVLGFRAPRQHSSSVLAAPALALASALLLALVIVPSARQTLHFVRYPEYTLVQAAHQVARIVRADPKHRPLLLSISGSDISLITGLPSICDDFGTLDLPERVKRYRPGWYAAWNEIDDDKMDSITPFFHIERVASFPAMDDPARNLLILYRLDPTLPTPARPRRRRPTPRSLQTREGQQPSTTQLEH